MADDEHFSQKMQRLEELIGCLESSSDPKSRSTARELVQLLMELHGAGLERMLDKLWQRGPAGADIIEELGHDELVSPLLLLYNLHPLDLQTRVLTALDKVRPYLNSHGGNVELLDLTNEGSVRLKLQGTCHGCPSSAITLKLAIEQAIYEAAPDITCLSVEGVVEQKTMPEFVTIPRFEEKRSAQNAPALAVPLVKE